MENNLKVVAAPAADLQSEGRSQIKPFLSEAEVAETMQSQEKGYLRFFFAAAVALLFSSVQGILMRVPDFFDWIRHANYGGRMVSILSFTHVTVVAAGTISMTALIYYVLPRVTSRPLFGKGISNLGFWFILIGVYGFYFSMIGMGLWEGSYVVNEGYTYEAARQMLDGWHRGLVGFAASFMGLGYWIMVANVLVTYFGGRKQRRLREQFTPDQVTWQTYPQTGGFKQKFFNFVGWNEVGKENDYYIAKFFAIAAFGLFIGTVQGVYQILPWSVEWLRKAGTAGQQIDPTAHAHINLVSVALALMGFSYYFLPRIFGRPVASIKLANFGWRMASIGMLSFWFWLIVFGFIEGDKVVSHGFTPDEARATDAVWRNLAIIGSACFMAAGFWSYISNIYLTLNNKLRTTTDLELAMSPATPQPVRAPWLASVLGISATFLLFGTIQGVIQSLPYTQKWLQTSGDAGYFVTPFAHAQLNTQGGVVLSLIVFMLFLAPRIAGRPLNQRLAKVAIGVLCVGITVVYAVNVTLGVPEGELMRQGYSFEQARQMWLGPAVNDALLITSTSLQGIGYLLFFVVMMQAIGVRLIGAYFGRWFAAPGRFLADSVRVHPRALPKNMSVAQSRALTATMLEVVPGMGWLATGRPKLATALLLFDFGVLLSTVFAVLLIFDITTDPPIWQLVAIYVAIAAVSAFFQYRTYVKQARQHLSQPPAPIRGLAAGVSEQVASRSQQK